MLAQKRDDGKKKASAKRDEVGKTKQQSHLEGFTPVKIYGDKGEVKEYKTNTAFEAIDFDVCLLRLGLKMTGGKSSNVIARPT